MAVNANGNQALKFIYKIIQNSTCGTLARQRRDRPGITYQRVLSARSLPAGPRSHIKLRPLEAEDFRSVCRHRGRITLSPKGGLCAVWLGVFEIGRQEL